MAATEKQTISFYSSDTGLPPVVRKVKIAAGQGIWMPGAGFYVSTSGTAKITDTSDGTGDVWHCFILTKITAEAAANTEYNASFIRPTSDIYQVYLDTGGTDAAESQAFVGDEIGLTVSTTAGEIGYTTATTGNTSATVHITDIMSNVDPEKFNTTDTPGVALCYFLPANVNASKA